MNENAILKAILSDPTLKKKYWPEINASSQNMKTLLRSDNRYVKSLYYLIDSKQITTQKQMINSIKRTFNL